MAETQSKEGAQMTDMQDAIAFRAFWWRDTFNYISRQQHGVRAVRDLDLVWKLRDLEQDARTAARAMKAQS